MILCEDSLVLFVQLFGRHGQLMEWSEDYDEAEPGHRHISHLWALHPGDAISPTRTPELVNQAIETLGAHEELDGVVSVSEPFFNPAWVGVKPVSEGSLELQRYSPDGTGVVRRQDVSRFLRINGSFYVWRAEFIRRLEKSWFDEGRHGFVEIPETHAFSIDDEKEFRLVEAVVTAGLAPLPGYGGSTGNPAIPPHDESMNGGHRE